MCALAFLDVYPVPNAPLGNLWREIKVETCPAYQAVEVRVSGRLYQEVRVTDGYERLYLQNGEWKVMTSHLAHATTTQGLQ